MIFLCLYSTEHTLKPNTRVTFTTLKLILCMLLSPGGFYDDERNLSALKLKCLSLALTRGCKTNVHAKREDPDMFVLQANRR